jgi:hypothetical protein
MSPHTLRHAACLVLSAFLLAGCDRDPQQLSIKIDGEMVKLDRSSIRVTPVPSYIDKDGKYTFIRKLSDADLVSVALETFQRSRLHEPYSPKIVISESDHKKAVKKFASLFNCSEQDARRILPPRDHWSPFLPSLSGSEIPFAAHLGPSIDYLKFTHGIRHLSVEHSPKDLYFHLQAASNIFGASQTLQSEIKPTYVYAVSKANILSPIEAVLFPGDPGWKKPHTSTDNSSQF